MADEGKGRISASVLLDNIKSRISGVFNVDAVNLTNATSGGEGWVYAEKEIASGDDIDLITTTESFLGPETTAADVASGDKVKFLIIEHTGYTTKQKTTLTSEGLLLVFDGLTVAFNTPDALLIESGEVFMFKAPFTTVDNLHVRTCTVSSGYPNALGTGTVFVKIAAVIQNV